MRFRNPLRARLKANAPPFGNSNPDTPDQGWTLVKCQQHSMLRSRYMEQTKFSDGLDRELGL
jgi:hypothetical protein